MSWGVMGETLVTLLVIMDPPGTAPIFLGLTSRMDAGERQRAALRAVFAAGMLIVGFALFGELVLGYLGISVESFSIAGGLLLLLVALEMLRGIESAPGADGDVALVPLATPLVAGPGAIATVIVLAGQNPGAGGRAAVIVGIVAAMLLLGAFLLLAERVSRLVRPAFLHFLTRVFGLLLAAIGVQLVVEGTRAIVSGA